jgi:hypothetical protein
MDLHGIEFWLPVQPIPQELHCLDSTDQLYSISLLLCEAFESLKARGAIDQHWPLLPHHASSLIEVLPSHFVTELWHASALPRQSTTQSIAGG